LHLLSLGRAGRALTRRATAGGFVSRRRRGGSPWCNGRVRSGDRRIAGRAAERREGMPSFRRVSRTLWRWLPPSRGDPVRTLPQRSGSVSGRKGRRARPEQGANPVPDNAQCLAILFILRVFAFPGFCTAPALSRRAPTPGLRLLSMASDRRCRERYPFRQSIPDGFPPVDPPPDARETSGGKQTVQSRFPAPGATSYYTAFRAFARVGALPL